MPDFKAYFSDEYVYVGGQAYKCNETLTACLNLPARELNDCLVHLWRLAPSVQLSGASAEQLRSFLARMQQTQELFLRIVSLTEGLPLFRGGVFHHSLKDKSLTDCLDCLCSDGGAAAAKIDDLLKFTDFYFLRVASYLARLSGAEAVEELDMLNRGIAGLFDQYIFLAGDILQAQRVYPRLLEKYIHEKRSFLSGAELAECFSRYRMDSAQSVKYERLPSSCLLKGSYEAFTDANGQRHFSLSYSFNRLRDFLYIDFFRGLERSHLPNRCDNCGRYFLLAGGKYSSYCDTPLPDDPQKTCRSIGAKKRYGSKCKTDPVWLTYNRAYKAHYARYMKGKMTAPEFERWSRYAVSLREQATDGTLSAEQYERLIKE